MADPRASTPPPCTADKPPKRRLSSAPRLDFFAPAASSFQPRPYAPHVLALESRSRSFQVRTQARPHETHPVPLASMDPDPSDPNVVFIHPPFTTFPKDHLHIDGLTFPLLAENPEWFLDAVDFISQHNTNPNAIAYPPHLEPPRGWCPAKKKDLRDRGEDGWREGEEPRLRCTFCRRTYAGVNAKSMWRRHVFEKHKIAMSNRRDGNDRPRGRGSGKENRHMTRTKSHDEVHDRIVNMDVVPQTELQTASHKSRFRSLLPAEEVHHHERERPKTKHKLRSPSVPLLASSPENSEVSCHVSSQPLLPTSPLTPHLSLSSDSTVISHASSDAPSSPTSAFAAIPPSPYNPLLTPSFRHSPPGLPSDQPWRFPSPSHPLHSQARELSLSMLVRDFRSPTVKQPTLLDQSPIGLQSSPAPSPAREHKIGLPIYETPQSNLKLPKRMAKTLLLRNQLSSPLAESSTAERNKYRIGSPLARSSQVTPLKRHRKMLSELTDDWLSEASFLSPGNLSLGRPQLMGSDPFVAMYNPWTPVRADLAIRGTPLKSTLEAESPVLRSTSSVGLGIGLLEPFVLPKHDIASPDGDFSEIPFIPLGAPEGGDDKEVLNVLTIPKREGCVNEVHEPSPPCKRRRTSGR